MFFQNFCLENSWYSCVGNLKLITNHQLGFLFALKSNRVVSIEKGRYLQIHVKVFRTMLKDQQRHYAVYLPDDKRLTAFDNKMLTELHDQHWQIEQYHRVIKQVCHIEHFQVRSQTAIRNHIFSSICGYVRLQYLRVTDLIDNCYSLQTNLFSEVISTFIQNFFPSIKHLGSQIHKKIPL